MKMKSLNARLMEIENQLKGVPTGQIRDFISELEGFKEKYSHNTQLLRDLGACYILAEDLESAENCFRCALEIDSKDAKIYCGLLSIAYRQSDDQKINEVYEAIKKNKPNNLSPLYGFGTQLYLDEQELNARDLFEALFEIDESPQAYHNLAVCCFITNKRKRARDLLDEGMKRYPDNPELQTFYNSYFELLHADYIITPEVDGRINVIGDDSEDNS